MANGYYISTDMGHFHHHRKFYLIVLIALILQISKLHCGKVKQPTESQRDGK